MAQVKLLKINSDGFSEEHGAADDATFATVTGATQVSVTGGVTLDSNITFNAVTDTIAGIQNQNLLDKTAAETITNTYTIDTGSKLILTDAPTLATHAANKDYVDSVALNNKRKDSVVVATTGNITLSGEQTIDGILTSTSRVLVWQQTDPKENGIYVSAAGAWARAADSDTSEEILGGLTKVLQGTLYDDVNFQNTNNTAPSIGVDDITYADLGSATSHNSLAGLQGGNGSTEYYHMTAAEDTWLNAATTKIAAGGDVVANNVNDTLTAVYTFTGDVDVSGGALEIPTAIDASPVAGGVYMDTGSQKVFGYDGTQYFDVGGSGTASAVTNNYTAGAGGIAQYDVVYISADDTVLKGDANAFASSKIVGFAPSAITAAASGAIQENGIISGVLTGATAGDAYFLGETPGTISTARPTTSGAFVTLVGYAKNATDLTVQIQQIGRRA
jgi:hypothetical protein